ncbi:hypothetical protein C8Q80DRAFT_1120027 [Daedaleopsis nitida]|nr:hypothetical protein C8Q80DRAFT_1120027 [Daedaleopsis nitida]
MASASANVPGAIPGEPIIARRRLPIAGTNNTMLVAPGDGAPILHPVHTGKMPPRLPWPDIGHLGKWSVSSYKFGFGPECLTDEDPDTFWHSDGPQPHFITVEFPRKVAVQKISMYLSFPLDDSYTPSTIAVRAGTGHVDMQDIRILSIEKPDGWITFDASMEVNEDGEGCKYLEVYVIQVMIVANHMNGKDTHVRGLKLLGPLESEQTASARGAFPIHKSPIQTVPVYPVIGGVPYQDVVSREEYTSTSSYVAFIESLACTRPPLSRLATALQPSLLTSTTSNGFSDTTSITNHGKINNWVSFALDHFQKYDDKPLVLHTLPAKGKAPAVERQADEPGTTADPALRVEKDGKRGHLHHSMSTIPRLVSVVEIIKREYLKTLDPTLAEGGSLSGLHQYNEIGDLEAAGYLEKSGNEQQDRLESVARALQGRNHLQQKKTAFMRITLCRKELPELAAKDATYQSPSCSGLVARILESIWGGRAIYKPRRGIATHRHFKEALDIRNEFNLAMPMNPSASLAVALGDPDILHIVLRSILNTAVPIPPPRPTPPPAPVAAALHLATSRFLERPVVWQHILAPQSDPEWADNLRTLRRHWKWANFSQFFYTFAPLLAMSDVFLSDRKLTIDNWQTALRRQYLRRDPAANPIGPEPKVHSQKDEDAEEDDAVEEDKPAEEPKPAEESRDTEPEEKPVPRGSPSEPKMEPKEEDKIPEVNDQHKVEDEEEQESKDWLELPMLDKLDSLHLLTEWQFHNPYRVRQLMKDDDDAGNWRIEPIGYDAKTNAYWLIGPDRLWIQRVPPKPPRNRNLKRKRSVVTPKKPARAPVEEPSSDDEEDEPVTRSKRTRVQSASRSKPHNQANGRATRASRRAAQSNASDIVSPGKSTRAAKVQANKKLDLQAKELAEFQRQAAALATTRARANSSPRKSRATPASPAKRAVGTRVSARLRHSAKADDEGDDDDQEWQQVPEEWLQESATPQRRTRARTRSKGKARAQSDEPEADAVDDADGRMDVEDEEQRNEEVRREGEAEGAETGEGEEEEEGDAEAVRGREDAEEDEDQDDLLQKAGLESGSVSDLTDLSDQEDSEAADEGELVTKRPRGGRGGPRKSVRTARSTQRAKPAVEASPSKSQRDAKAESDEDQEMEEPAAPPFRMTLSSGKQYVMFLAPFIAVTLTEWEQVAEPFTKATHYLEKALYKMLARNIVPNVTADLREAEKRKRMEEAIVHRKRSSRIASKESEKEEARMAAKRKAEEDEKFGRARRQEARRMKEEAEREKRERARDQRAKEREEREARARAKAERAEREETAAARSTATPSINGTHQSSSIQPSRVVTPNGVRTPDWVLDCEVCGRRGVNVDDGKAMVSCGSCNRWQHIACHDYNDQRTGRPRRDWEKQQFYCTRCRQRQLNGGAHGAHGYVGHQQQQYGWGQSSGPILLHKPGGMDPYAHSSDMRYAHRSPLENGTGYSQQQQHLPNNVGAASYSRALYPNSGLSFNHYQPDQRGLSSRSIPTTPQGSWSSNGGYGAVPDPLAPRAGSSHFSPQYGHNGAGSMYPGGSRTPAAYPNHPSPSVARYDDRGAGMSSSRWPSTTPNGYHSPAMHEAAQSLAFMHDSSSSRYNSSGWGESSSSYGQHVPASSSSSSQSHQSSFAHAPVGPGIDPLTGQSFSRVEQQPHAGHGLPHTNGATSFGFPS